MPNWCSNNLLVEGPAAELALFMSKIEDKAGLFDAYFPMPTSLREAVSGSDEQCYQVLYGDIPAHILELEVVSEAGLDKSNANYRSNLFDVLKETLWRDQSNLSRETALRYKTNLDRYGSLNWYDWSIKNWGTKWDVSLKRGEVSIDYDKGRSVADLAFDTAWGPPTEWVDSVSKDWPDLTFSIKYFEPGMWFAGYYKVKAGMELSRLEGDPDQKDLNGNPLFGFCEDEVEEIKSWDNE